MSLREEALHSALDHLPERERNVVKLRYGINGDDPTPLRETGRRLGLSPERVRQIEGEALKRLALTRELEGLSRGGVTRRDEDPTTEELRLDQLKRERELRKQAERRPAEDDTGAARGTCRQGALPA